MSAKQDPAGKSSRSAAADGKVYFRSVLHAHISVCTSLAVLGKIQCRVCAEAMDEHGALLASHVDTSATLIAAMPRSIRRWLAWCQK